MKQRTYSQPATHLTEEIHKIDWIGYSICGGYHKGLLTPLLSAAFIVESRKNCIAGCAQAHS
jgi:hypothetical protein